MSYSEGALKLHALIADLTTADVSDVAVFTVAGGRTEVKLSDVLVGLDKSNQRRVVETVARAVGLVHSL